MLRIKLKLKCFLLVLDTSIINLILSIFAANIKSLSASPFIACVKIFICNTPTKEMSG